MGSSSDSSSSCSRDSAQLNKKKKAPEIQTTTKVSVRVHKNGGVEGGGGSDGGGGSGEVRVSLENKYSIVHLQSVQLSWCPSSVSGDLHRLHLVGNREGTGLQPPGYGEAVVSRQTNTSSYFSICGDFHRYKHTAQLTSLTLT